MNLVEQREALINLNVDPTKADELVHTPDRRLADRILPGGVGVTEEPGRELCVDGFGLLMGDSAAHLFQGERDTVLAAVVRVANGLGCTVIPKPTGV